MDSSTIAETNIMGDIVTIPPRLTTLGSALRPCLAKLQRCLAGQVRPDIGIDDGIAWLQSGLGRLQTNAAGLHNQFEQLTREILANKGASDANVYRGAGRFEAYLDGFLDDRDSVRRTIAPGELAEARDLLAGAYRHTLVEIRDWLSRFISILDGPLAEARRQGLSANGPIELELTLTLTAAPEMVRLSAWADRKREKINNVGFWSLLGGLAIGALFLDGIIDNDCGSDS
jgi:hypothetical protein